jgi:DeoR/GlpR family transcriptional regulator of sugar metabolism
MKRALARRAAETHVLASVEKLGAAPRFDVPPLTDIAGIVTDGHDNDVVNELSARGVNILNRDGDG